MRVMHLFASLLFGHAEDATVQCKRDVSAEFPEPKIRPKPSFFPLQRQMVHLLISAISSDIQG